MEEKIDKAIEVAKGRLLALTAQADMQKAAQAILNLAQVKGMYAAEVKAGTPTDELNEEIGFVLGRVRSNLGATELQQVTQAALHLMHAKSQCEAISRDMKPAKATKTKTD